MKCFPRRIKSKQRLIQKASQPFSRKRPLFRLHNTLAIQLSQKERVKSKRTGQSKAWKRPKYAVALAQLWRCIVLIRTPPRPPPPTPLKTTLNKQSSIYIAQRPTAAIPTKVSKQKSQEFIWCFYAIATGKMGVGQTGSLYSKGHHVYVSDIFEILHYKNLTITFTDQDTDA